VAGEPELFRIKKKKLEFRFGEGHLARTYYSQFINRRLKNREDYITLGARMFIAISLSGVLPRIAG